MYLEIYLRLLSNSEISRLIFGLGNWTGLAALETVLVEQWLGSGAEQSSSELAQMVEMVELVIGHEAGLRRRDEAGDTAI